MTLRVELSDDAAREIDEAFLWYLDRSAGIAEAFVTEVERAIAVVAEAPEVWPEFDPGFRRYVLRRFPHRLIYSLYKDHLVVEALAHQSREPGYWRKR